MAIYPSAHFEAFDPNTIKVFEKIKSDFSLLKAITIEHVGSTSFGAGGKNVVDVLILTSEENLNENKRKLVQRQFEELPMGKTRKTHMLLGKETYSGKEYQIVIHLATPDMKADLKMITFRDFMRRHPKLIKDYEKVKKEALSKGKLDNKEYNAEKDPFIKTVLQKIG